MSSLREEMRKEEKEWTAPAFCAACGGQCCHFAIRGLYGQSMHIGAGRFNMEKNSPEINSLCQAASEYLGIEIIGPGSTRKWDGWCEARGEHGCRLPRDMRPQVCRRFVCWRIYQFLPRLGVPLPVILHSEFTPRMVHLPVLPWILPMGQKQATISTLLESLPGGQYYAYLVRGKRLSWDEVVREGDVLTVRPVMPC